jgi:hypothetical protein
MHFDSTITLGNFLTFVLLVIAIIKFYNAQAQSKRAEIEYRKDIEWRMANLETWRKEHMVDADARDALLKKLDKVCDHLEWLIKDRQRENVGRRSPREGQS